DRLRKSQIAAMFADEARPLRAGLPEETVRVRLLRQGEEPPRHEVLLLLAVDRGGAVQKAPAHPIAQREIRGVAPAARIDHEAPAVQADLERELVVVSVAPGPAGPVRPAGDCHRHPVRAHEVDARGGERVVPARSAAHWPRPRLAEEPERLPAPLPPLASEPSTESREVAVIAGSARAEGKRLARVGVADLRRLPAAVHEAFRGGQRGADPPLLVGRERDAQRPGREGPEEKELGGEAV